MVEQPLGQAARQHQFVVGHGDEAVAQRVEPELRAALLADARVEMLRAADAPGTAGLGREDPGPAPFGETVARGQAAFEDCGYLPGGSGWDRQFAGPPCQMPEPFWASSFLDRSATEDPPIPGARLHCLADRGNLVQKRPRA